MNLFKNKIHAFSMRLIANIRLFVVQLLWRLPPIRSFAESRLPTYRKGYKHYWVEARGGLYRLSMYDRQRQGGTAPLISNPTTEEMASAIGVYNPGKVLEVGCGYGRSLEMLETFFAIEGCDISAELLERCRPDLKVFNLDIVDPGEDWLAANMNGWDVIFCRAVTQYFFDHPDDMKKAMETMEKIAAKKVIVWEWKHVCAFMQSVYPSERFEYHPIALKSE